MNSEQGVKETYLNSRRMQIKQREYWVGKPNELSRICAEILGTGRKTIRMDIKERAYNELFSSSCTS